NQVGELPGEDVAYEPTILPGALDKGKMLANVLQKAAPEGEAAAEVEIISGNFEAAHQEAEQALTKEEIPRGSKEFVRQYFGTLDPAASAQ
ncbi:MAG: hypothetical protein HYZ00_14550, partial [Candidatus Hydrogenedentes bacterium]|nr:hypothetical protein [Candidatus Hydrogenedentota bacterium]